MSQIVKNYEQYRIVRETRENSPYKYDFVLYSDTHSDDGTEEIITSSEVLDSCGFNFESIDDKTNLMTVFAGSYLRRRSVEDGLGAVVREYNS
jgi:hypothetical protein